jgi:membrane fusion protein (multidrug efflux system)
MGSKVIEPEPTREQEEAPPPRRRLAGRWAEQRFRKILFGGAAIVLVGLAGLIYYLRGRVTTDDAQVDGHITPISSKVYGKVARVLVNDNEHVKAGQPLIEIDPRDYQARVDQARAALALAESQLEAAGVNVPLTEGTTSSEIKAAKAAVALAEAELARARLAYQSAATAGLGYAEAQVAKRQADNDRAQADLARMKPLAAKEEISQLQYDAFLEKARSAQSDLEAAKQKLLEAQQQVAILRGGVEAAEAHLAQAKAGLSQAEANAGLVPVRKADASSASAAVEKARADLQAAELQLGYTKIVAPDDGVVTNKSVEPGQVVQPGQQLFVLVALHDVYVTANFKETQLARVHPGQRAEVHVDMYGRSFPGHVDSVAGATGSKLSLLPPENATGNFVKVVQRIPVKIVLDPIPPSQAILRPGMNVEATIYTR